MSIEPIIVLDSDKLVLQKVSSSKEQARTCDAKLATSVLHKTMVYNLISLF